jgi:hypothetical protein
MQDRSQPGRYASEIRGFPKEAGEPERPCTGRLDPLEHR